jgi:hypothetical protein
MHHQRVHENVHSSFIRSLLNSQTLSKSVHSEKHKPENALTIFVRVSYTFLDVSESQWYRTINT